MGVVNVEKRGGVIYAEFVGEMDLNLIQSAAFKMIDLMDLDGRTSVLYNVLGMKMPGVEITRWMQKFGPLLDSRVEQCAAVVPDFFMAAQTKAAFINVRNHRQFENVEAALSWLEQKRTRLRERTG